METNIARTRVMTIEASLIYSVRLLADMDSAAGFGGVRLIPEVFIWTLEQINPSLIQQLRGLDLLDRFRLRLAQYQELRALAGPLRFENHLRAEAEICTDLQDVGYLGLHDIQYALDYGDWRPADRSARLCFKRVLRASSATPYPQYEMVGDLGEPLPFGTKGSFPACEQFATVMEDTSATLYAQMAEPVETALKHIRRELVANDDGRKNRHWAHVYTSVLGAWLQEDLPELAAEVLAAGQAEAFFTELARFRHSVEQVEHIWNAMGKTVRALVLRADEPTASLVIAEFVRADDTAEDELPAWTSLLRNMLKRRGSAEASAERNRMTEIVATRQTSDAAEQIRHAPNALHTCYLISCADLPESLRGTVSERQCLAVRLPEERLQIAQTLGQAPGLECFFSEETGPGKVCKTQLSVSRVFWCEYNALWPALFRFRRAIPVLFIFDQQCILVQYPFEHFSDLRQITDVHPRYYSTVYISDGPWTDWLAQESLDSLPDGTQLKPAMLEQVIDLCGRIHANPLADAYSASRPAQSY
ncbi:hypothetical protein [Paraburkholderia sp. RL17-337-BIB-A]|uniref:hypothetical protein n=1 Tax=Paraburkholderia sp. RL17-337-BIB-A TaxID=3031636 RepID=UPI0038B965FA